MPAEHYHVRLSKDYLVFSAAHFITFAGHICERIHGHNYRVEAEVHGPLDTNKYVIDFIALRDALKARVDAWDHHVLLPTQHPQIRVTWDEQEVLACFENRRWVFPREDCILLPVENTTAELLARTLGHVFAGRPPASRVPVAFAAAAWRRREQWSMGLLELVGGMRPLPRAADLPSRCL